MYECKKVGTVLIFFNKTSLCRVQEITIVEKGDFGGEGLFSPDVYDGKCLLSGGIEKE